MTPRRHLSGRTIARAGVATVGAAALLALATPAVALAAPGSGGSGGSGDSGGSTGSGDIGSIDRFGSVDPSGSAAGAANVGSTGSSGLSSLASLGTLPQIPTGSQNLNAPQPALPQADHHISEVAVTEVEGSDWDDLKGNDRFERWWVSSPSMQREVPVEIWYPKDRSEPSPIIYMLDGVDSPYPSGWYTAGNTRQIFDDDQVTLVAIQGAVGSLHADWDSDDPVLGRNEWETFITDELPQVTEHGSISADGQSHDGIAFNGDRGIAGLSMGAASAVDIAEHNPGMYETVGAISGCYTPTTDLGFLLAKITVETRGGHMANVWGPDRLSDEYDDHNSLANIGELRGKPMFFSAANGAPDPDSWTGQYDQDMLPFVQGAALEEGVHACTVAMQDKIDAEGMSGDATFDFQQTGMHNWANFGREIQPMHDVMMPALS